MKPDETFQPPASPPRNLPTSGSGIYPLSPLRKFLSLSEYIAYAGDKLKEHGLDGWRVRWAHRGSIATCGRCICSGQIIELNKDYYFLTQDHNVLLDTVLHEVAHALNFKRHHVGGHSTQWKAICREIGARPERLNHDAVMPTKNTKGIGSNRAAFTLY